MRRPVLALLLALCAACSDEAKSNGDDGHGSGQDAALNEPNDAGAVERDADVEAADAGAQTDAVTSDTDEDEGDGGPGDAGPSDAGDAGSDTSAGDVPLDTTDPVAVIDGWRPALGATVIDGELHVAVPAPNATRVEAWLYAEPRDAHEIGVLILERDEAGTWRGSGPLPDGARWYGLRAWGPNFDYDPDWVPGSLLGFVTDVDELGNRFNPNKLLVDPWALELSHDPKTAIDTDTYVYRSGDEHRATDSALRAPKGLIVTPQVPAERPARPTRSLDHDVIYEVHVRNFTRNATDIPAELRGTYAGAALRAPYLAELGVTAIEFLPLHETQNEQNDVAVGAEGDNMWGYASLSFFAPERRYAADRSPGGATRELIAMVDAFHAHGIKVFVDVVYNHTGEGGAWGEQREIASLLSWRGLDNSVFYQTWNGRSYRNDNGVGPNMRFTTEATQQLVIDSLRYWHETIGVDGFRFDLASVLGNVCEGNCFTYSADTLLTRIAEELPARPVDGGTGVDLIAEPWAIGPGTYQVGNFPAGWWEWNDRFRDFVRDAQNVPSVAITPGQWAVRLDGSTDLFEQRDGSAAINFVAAHDGFALFDLYACNEPVNEQPWPWGPSDGGSTYNRSWDQDGDETLQRQAARTGLALLVLSGGVPMFNGGDERLRSQRCNNNPYNIDSDAMGIDWSGGENIDAFVQFTTRLLQLRAQHAELRERRPRLDEDRDADGRPDLEMLDLDGTSADAGTLSDAAAPVFAWRLDFTTASAGSMLVAWNRTGAWHTFTLPEPAEGTGWWRACDTDDFLEPDGNCVEESEQYRMGGRRYDLNPRSLVVWIER